MVFTSSIASTLWIDQYLAVLQHHRVGSHRAHGRESYRPAGNHVEAGAVPWTFDEIAVEEPLVERATVVSTDVGNRVDLSIDVAERNRLPVSLDITDSAGFNLAASRHSLEGHSG